MSVKAAVAPAVDSSALRRSWVVRLSPASNVAPGMHPWLSVQLVATHAEPEPREEEVGDDEARLVAAGGGHALRVARAARGAGARRVRVAAAEARGMLARRGRIGGTDRERRRDAERERERDAVGRHPGRLEAGAGSPTAVGVGVTRTELVRHRPGRAELRAEDPGQPVRVRDRLARDERIA